MLAKKRYAICGVSARANGMFIKPMLDAYRPHCEIAALLDPDPVRFDNCVSKFPELQGVPAYRPEQFAQMIDETKPDVLIVAGADYTHADYIVQGLEIGLDVISEKPMATTSTDCRRILEAQANSKGTLYVTFNYRYNPIHSKIKEMILEGRIGRVTSVDLNWYLDTYHGASYFKRWNRKREISGGLSIHKSTHHFDLVNWWIDQKPVEAFAYGALNYYGSNGELNPAKEDGRFCGTCRVKQQCAYTMRWSSRSKAVVPPDDHLIHFNDTKTKSYSGYRPDACIFDSDIDIEDTYTAVVKYDKGAMLSYSVNFSLPYEGYRLAINGTKGRIETKEIDKRSPFQAGEQTIDYFPLFGGKETIHVLHRQGGHGGGDPLLLEDLFLGPDPSREYDILAGAEAGTLSVLTGEAVWKSVRANRPIRIDELLKGEG